VKLLDTQKGGVRVRGGVAEQANMWRVDVFEKDRKFFLVPIYQSDRRKGAELPNLACVAHKPRSQWDWMDESFQFRFSLYPNDAVLLKQRGKEYLGYFAGTDIASANVSINSHDRNSDIGKDGQWRGLGVKLGVDAFEKFHIDVLGNIHPAKPEVRRGLA
jgi:CRISPR-associated endonuclease Csn1